MMKALVVDDSRTIRMMLRKILSDVGYEVCEAGNGREALLLVDDAPGTIGLVLVDWNMPEMNGFELLLKLRLRPALASMKIVMVTTEAELGHMTAALAAGADEYIMKPFTRDILREKVEMLGVFPGAVGQINQ